MLRTGRKSLAAATLLLDALKGVAAVLIAKQIGDVAAVGAAAGAVIGHMFPVWLSFKGGKGMATTLGIMWGLSWPVGAIACAAWLLFAAVFRYSSLAALLSVLIGAIAAWFFADHRAAAAAHAAGAAGLGAAPREYRPPAQGNRAQDRPAQPFGPDYLRRVKPSGLQSSLPTP